MTTVPIRHPVARVLNRPLTVWGVDRRVFFLGLIAGGATFNLVYSFLAGLVVFVVIYALAWGAMSVDPQAFSILLRSASQRRRYDPAQRTAIRVRRVRSLGHEARHAD